MSRLSFKVAPRPDPEPQDFAPIIGPMTALLIAFLIGLAGWVAIIWFVLKALPHL